MTKIRRDFASTATKIGQKNKPRAKASKQRVSVLMVLTVATMIVAFGGGIYFLQQQNKRDAHRAHLAQAEKEVAEKKKVAQLAEPKPQFEFYNILPNTIISDSDVVPDRVENVFYDRYLLRVAAYRDPKEADRLKAELTLLGFNVVLSKVNVKGKDWTQIVLGPYSSEAAAKDDMSRLLENHYRSELLHITS